VVSLAVCLHGVFEDFQIAVEVTSGVFHIIHGCHPELFHVVKAIFFVFAFVQIEETGQSQHENQHQHQNNADDGVNRDAPFIAYHIELLFRLLFVSI